MLRRLLALGTLATALTAAVGLAGQSAAAQPIGVAGGGAQIRIVLDCESTPEKTTITNRGTSAIEIESVGSLFGRADGEPYAVGETLKRGQTLTLESGEDARGPDKLTDRELYDDDSNRDGARVNTSKGTFKERC